MRLLPIFIVEPLQDMRSMTSVPAGLAKHYGVVDGVCEQEMRMFDEQTYGSRLTFESRAHQLIVALVVAYDTESHETDRTAR